MLLAAPQARRTRPPQAWGDELVVGVACFARTALCLLYTSPSPRDRQEGSSTFGTQTDQHPPTARAVRAKPATPTKSSSPQACGGRVRRACGAARSTGLAASAQRVRKHFHCACLNGARKARAVSCAMGRKTEHRSAVGAFSARPPHRSAAPGPHRPGATQRQTNHRPGEMRTQTNQWPGAARQATVRPCWHAGPARH